VVVLNGVDGRDVPPVRPVDIVRAAKCDKGRQNRAEVGLKSAIHASFLWTVPSADRFTLIGRRVCR